jgi:16S rRNA processing protein RimM
LTGSRQILVARVAGAFGVSGEVRITAFTETPLALLDYRRLTRADGSAGLTLVSARAVKGGIVARAKEIQTREQAEALKGVELFVERDALPEPDDDEFYLADLIGLEARDPAGAAVGRVKSVQNFGAGDLLEIEPAQPGPSWWLAFTRETAPEVRLADGVIVIVRPAEVSDQPAGDEIGR